MAKKIYVSEPKILAPTGPDEVWLCFQVFEWDQGQLGYIYPPCNEEGRVAMVWGDGIVEIRQKAIDNLLSYFPDITSNDIIFLGGWN
jgi:hypothetical protein